MWEKQEFFMQESGFYRFMAASPAPRSKRKSSIFSDIPGSRIEKSQRFLLGQHVGLDKNPPQREQKDDHRAEYGENQYVVGGGYPEFGVNRNFRDNVSLPEEIPRQKPHDHG